MDVSTEDLNHSISSSSFENQFLLKNNQKTKNKHFQINKNKSKMEWNFKYAFPKSKDYNLFDYKAKKAKPPSKIDLLNKHLDKKIMNKPKESDMIKNFND